MTKVGEIRKAQELGFKSNGSMLYIWALCKNCSKARWVRLVKGHPESELCKSCSCSHKREKHPKWKGRINNPEGYILIPLGPDDFFYSMARKDGYIFEHRLIMAKHLNRCLLSWETIHHKNGVKNDNRIENLELLPNPNKHDALTRMARYIKKLEREIEILRKD